MIRARGWGLVLLAATAVFPAVAMAGGFSVKVWTDRGADAVYEQGDRIVIRSRASVDANLLVYDIDAEGNLHVLFPYRERSGYVEGEQTLMIPDENSADELVVRGPVGQGYIVAIASRSAFKDLPPYLRPYDPQAEGVGYVGDVEGAEGDSAFVTHEGRIVGDPFVAIERIRRRVLSDPENGDDFATAYVSYYVHDQVRYPRYVCYDCHRPGHYAWWDGFDPYYASCSVVDFRVNFGWAWGYPYWFGYTPYYVYVVRPSCPPYYQPWVGTCYSSWDGYGRWNTLWGSHLVRYKPAAPPPGYIPPSKYKWNAGWQDNRPAPPGFLAAGSGRGLAQRMPATRTPDASVIARRDWRAGGEARQPVLRAPAGAVPREGGGIASVVGRQNRGAERAPAGGAGHEGGPRTVDRGQSLSWFEPRHGRSEPSANPRVERPTQRSAPPRYERPAPRSEPPRNERRAPQSAPPRYERPAPQSAAPRYERPAQRSEPPRYERSASPPRENRNGGGHRGGGR